MARKKSKGTELSVFKGREARLNRAIFQVLSAQEPQATWDIFKNVTKLRGLKRKRYAVIELRIISLEAQGYLIATGERTTKQGSKTPLFKMTTKAKLAISVGSRTIDDLFRELDEATASTILKALSKRFSQNDDL